MNNLNTTATQDTTREAWLNKASDLIRATIIDPACDSHAIIIDHEVKVAVSIGHPTHKKAIGECWARRASDDNATNQIFITPFNNDSLRVLDVLTHELIHAYDDNKNGHKGRFATLARACDLQGKLTATTAGEQLKEQLLDIIDIIGDIPHVKLNQAQRPTKKQTTRMLKVECDNCEFVFRASRTQLQRIADNMYVNSHISSCPCCNMSINNQVLAALLD